MNNHEQLIDGLGLWSEVISKNENLENRPALFLDRDGTIVSYEEFLHDPLKIKINSNICSLIKACNLIKIPVIEITNQSGIGRGFYDWNDFNKTEIEIRKQLSLNSAHINMLCACAFHKDAKEGRDYNIEEMTWMWDQTTIADKKIIENNQKGVLSKKYVPGPLTEMEKGLEKFKSWYLKHLDNCLA